MPNQSGDGPGDTDIIQAETIEENEQVAEKSKRQTTTPVRIQTRKSLRRSAGLFRSPRVVLDLTSTGTSAGTSSGRRKPRRLLGSSLKRSRRRQYRSVKAPEFTSPSSEPCQKKRKGLLLMDSKLRNHSRIDELLELLGDSSGTITLCHSGRDFFIKQMPIEDFCETMSRISNSRFTFCWGSLHNDKRMYDVVLRYDDEQTTGACESKADETVDYCSPLYKAESTSESDNQ